MTWSDGDTAGGVTDSNNFWTGAYYNTAAQEKNVYNHPLVITLKKMPKL
jgi:mannan endo-1,4-beta-mannosidase